MTRFAIDRVADAETVARRAAETVAAALLDALAQRGVAHLALTGGTSPERCYELLGPMLDDWSGVHLWYGDERCVPPDDDDSNARMVHKTLRAPDATEHRMRGELGPDDGAAAYAQELGDTVLDLTLLGIGPDGHIASLMPDHAELDATGATVAVHDSPKPPPERISLTLPTINASRAILVIVAGAGKAGAVAAMLGEPSRSTPASLLDRGRTTLLVDADALPGGAA